MAQDRTIPVIAGILILGAVLLLDVMLASLAQAQTINQCRRNWVLTEVTPMDFGAFAIESGSGTITMNSAAALTTSGLINLSTSQPVTTFEINVDNTQGVNCVILYGFNLYWQRVPQPLNGPGTSIPQSNPLVSIPAYGLNDVALPQTIAANPGNTLPFTVRVYSTISPTAPQVPGAYQSQPRHIFVLQQSTRNHRVRSRSFATVFSPLSISETVSMDFGTIAGGPTPGTVVLNTAGGRSTTGGAQTLAAGPGTAGSFQITGEPSQAYSLTFGNGVLSNGSGQTMTLNSFTDNSSGSLSGAGIETFQVGGTIDVGANQAAGSYSTANGGGTPYTITVSYN